MYKFIIVLSLLVLLPLVSCSQANKPQGSSQASLNQTQESPYPGQKSEAEWKKLLTAEQYYILRQKGTERAFTGAYWNHSGRGVYHCAACEAELFSSSAKFNSGTGWPSYWQPISQKALANEPNSGMGRNEVVCGTCGGHLGHVFKDGPPPTGLRYCINSASLKFKGEEKEKE